ncbi:chaplin, partial [Streptomyces sp. ISL-44]|uniref:chaplin n=1 Tax=Streptomyces sp. ISL-44 TaxID=2819184 RepID=UPI0027E298DD
MGIVLGRGLLAAATTSGILGIGGGIAYADAQADGTSEGSPGAASGNSVQAPIHFPLNVCGNTINIVGLVNPVFGNTCSNGEMPRGSTPPVSAPPVSKPPGTTPP